MRKLHRTPFFIKGSQIYNKALVDLCLSLVDSRKYLSLVCVGRADEDRNVHIKFPAIFQALKPRDTVLSVDDERYFPEWNMVIIIRIPERRQFEKI